jgi:hypothetical protein
LRKGLYGLIQSARLWYNKLSGELASLGFAKNPIDECVFNRVDAEGQQLTLAIHVDDVMITAASEAHIDALLGEFDALYPELTVHRGRNLDYLGMHFCFAGGGKVRVTMPAYIDEVLECAADFTGVAASPAQNDLFDVGSSPALGEAEKLRFHSLAAKLLYLAKRVRPDILLAVSFLVRRVQAPNRSDQQKIGRVVKYLRGARDFGLVLEADKAISACGWIDASFGVHADLKSHTGAAISLGKGPLWAKSSVQRLNTKSSTEAELVGVSDAVGQLFWLRHFLQGQGYDVGPATLYQDNQSTIALMENGKSGCERTRHIAIRYFFVKDRIGSGEIRVEYCPTDAMVADSLTKPMQGAKFRDMRALLLNWYDDAPARVIANGGG